jgi:small subunit ribosomal protein S3
MDIDYASVFAQTVYGKIGIKVWICKGEVLGQERIEIQTSLVVKTGGLQGTEEITVEMTEVVSEVETEEVEIIVGGGGQGGGGDNRGGGGQKISTPKGSKRVI